MTFSSCAVHTYFVYIFTQSVSAALKCPTPGMQTVGPFLFMSCIVASVGTGWAYGVTGPYVFGMTDYLNCVIPLLTSWFCIVSFCFWFPQLNSPVEICSFMDLTKSVILYVCFIFLNKQISAVAWFHTTVGQSVLLQEDQCDLLRGFWTCRG